MLLEGVYQVTGPFVIPVVLFVLGVLAYGGLVALQRLRSARTGDDSTDK